MEISPSIQMKKANVLNSGSFYYFHSVAPCYRVQEVDHFRKTLETQLLLFVDKSGNCHHFNQSTSQQSATTPLSSLLQIPNLESVAFSEIDGSFLKSLQAQEEGPEEESLAILYKLVHAFDEKQSENQGETFDVDALLKEYHGEFINSPELA